LRFDLTSKKSYA
ncbi:hypothetical protein CP061683_0661B, partial [Chlamydia psittaci 06-1683]